MSEKDENLENKDNEKEKDDVKPTAESKKTEDEHMIPKSRLDEEIQKRKDAEKRADAMEKAQKEAERQRLEEQNDYKKLYEGAQVEIGDYKPKAERADVLESVLKETLEAELENIPQDKRALIPDELSIEGQLRYISKNRAQLSKVQPFDIGAGKNGGQPQKDVKLTQEQKEAAQKMGVSEEDYAKQLQ